MVSRTKTIYAPPVTLPIRIVDKPPFTFSTGSVYIGSWNILGMAGEGLYRLPHGVIYEGEMHDGMFHGQGVMHYPNGCKVMGSWDRGRLMERTFLFSDGNEYEESNYNYCKKPDRRFATELERGLKPAGRSQLTNDHPPRPIPDGCYDTGEGFYNPTTKCLMDPRTGEIKRIPTQREEKWILKHCRKAMDENVGYRPDLYEEWFEEGKESSSDDEITKTLSKYSKAESSMNFTASMLQLMQSAIGASDPVMQQMFVSSGFLNNSDLDYISHSSKPSMDKAGGLDIDFISKVNTEFSRRREEGVLGDVDEA